MSLNGASAKPRREGGAAFLSWGFFLGFILAGARFLSRRKF